MMTNEEKIVWHKIKMRPATKEEIEYFKENLDYFDDDEQEVFDCEMPDDGEEILVVTKYGVSIDTCLSDDYGYGLEENSYWDGIIAWAKIPVYREGESNDDEWR